MDDRKYRQRGYQDEPRRRREPKRDAPAPQEPRAPGRPLQDASGPRTPNLMGSHEVFRCARCGVDLHSCVQCVSFDTSARFECTQLSLTARVSPKDAKNDCRFFAPRTTVERQTGTAGPPSARQAFDDLFK